MYNYTVMKTLRDQEVRCVLNLPSGLECVFKLFYFLGRRCVPDVKLGAFAVVEMLSLMSSQLVR